MLPSNSFDPASGGERPTLSHLTAAIVETLQQPVLVLRSDLTVEMANPAFLQCFEVVEKDTHDRYLYDLGNGQWNIPELRERLDGLGGGDEEVDSFRVEHVFEDIGRRVMLVNARRLREEPGQERILLAITDVTERERLQNELIARVEFGEKLIDSVREALLVLDRRFVVETANKPFYDLFGVTREETEGHLLYDIGEGQWDIPALRRAMEEVLPRQKAFDDFEVTHEFPQLGIRCMLLNGRQLDHMPRILLAIRDETERRRSQAAQKIMVGELQHRVKNILANVQAIASSTLRRSDTLDDFGDGFLQRLAALARTQDLLLRGPSGEVDLRQLIEAELGAHGWEVDGRLSLEGPQVTLSRRETQALAMVIHELATNAVKYGAFATPRGRLDIAWHPAGGDDELTIEWLEKGVDLHQPPNGHGFGTGLIRHSIHHMLGGDTDLEFAPGGVRCSLTFPLGQREN